MSNNPAKHEVLIKQYLRSILDISGQALLSTLGGSLSSKLIKLNCNICMAMKDSKPALRTA